MKRADFYKTFSIFTDKERFSLSTKDSTVVCYWCFSYSFAFWNSQQIFSNKEIIRFLSTFRQKDLERATFRQENFTELLKNNSMLSCILFFLSTSQFIIIHFFITDSITANEEKEEEKMGVEGEESFRTMEVKRQFPYGTAVELRTCSGKGSLKANNTLNMCRVCEYDVILPERYFFVCSNCV